MFLSDMLVLVFDYVHFALRHLFSVDFKMLSPAYKISYFGPKAFPLRDLPRDKRTHKMSRRGGDTFPSLFQVMKKPNSSTLIWQLGSKKYGSCRGKRRFLWDRGLHHRLLTFNDIQQPTCFSPTHTRTHTHTGLCNQTNKCNANSFPRCTCRPEDTQRLTHKVRTTHLVSTHTSCVRRRWNLLLRQTQSEINVTARNR